MNRYKRFVCIILGIEILVFILCNGLYLAKGQTSGGRLYRVEAERVARELQDKTAQEIDLSEYDTIVRVGEFNANQKSDYDYIVEQVGGTLYRIEYVNTRTHNAIVYINIALGLMLAFTAAVLLYIRKKILKPFHSMSGLPYELAKGNLTMPVKEEKSKFFGQFLWGMDMLRESLEENRRKELELQREKKTLILSLSHDIKTPLSAIELYTKALSQNLYDTEEKRAEALRGITKNVNDIRNYMDEIVHASREDFLNLDVKPGEFYLSGVMSAIETYYREKLSVVHTEFVIEKSDDCLLKGDLERVVEILQNLMENAVKYGDGKRIGISFDEEENSRLITVENTGCKLKQEELPHLFDSFYRGSNSRGVSGSGLGLYISRNLIKKMGGDIFARIENDIFKVTVVIRKV